MKFVFCCLFICFSYFEVNCDRILGCNGFIKSDIPIDYSKIEVKLFSKKGNLKDKIECAPNNGYFFVPLYDKGEYILKVSSIYKWDFGPSEVHINFDGVSDACSRGKDINFFFKGFRVYGKVGSIGDRPGPKGVTVTLVADLPTEQQEIKSISTEDDGYFDISPVLPGSYIIKASHSKWRISKSLTTFKVENGNYELPLKSLLLAGYDVRGSVVSSGDPMPGINFVLFSTNQTMVDQSWLSGCDKSLLVDFVAADAKLTYAEQLCHVASNDAGTFVFPSVPSGDYYLVPFYKSVEELKFDVHPRLVRFTVAQDSYTFAKPFQVSGFSVVGRLLSRSINGRPLAGLKVIIDKERLAETKSDGTFVFEGVKSGIHTISVKSNEMEFNETTVNIVPTSASLEPIYPQAFRVCGHVKKLQEVETAVKFLNENGNWFETETGVNGSYCQFLPSGNYIVDVVPIGARPDNILWFMPVNYKLTVTDSTLMNINFEQKTGVLSGHVECHDDSPCDKIGITLVYLDIANISYHIKTKNGNYTFTGLSPGYYELKVDDTDDWCWDTVGFRIYISELESKAPTFRRIGLSLEVYSSHNVKLNYLSESTAKTGELDLKTGTERYCLSAGGTEYVFTPVGCHRYKQSVFRWSTGEPPLHLEAVSHLITAFIISSERVDDLYVNVYDDYNTSDATRLGPLKASKELSNGHLYTFEFQAANKEKMTLVPESMSLLFTPTFLTVYGGSDCAELDNHFLAKRGIRLQGSVDPSLQNVKISIVNELDEILISMFTDDRGKYGFMPLHSDQKYRVIAEKEGYVLTGPFENGLFKAHKLAEIVVTLVDEENKPLQGVLLSLSGGENYRETSQSNSNGEVNFLSLKPSEYYLRPMLKEYKFSPSSKVINVTEGETIEVKFQGHRVLFSIFGSVQSLNRVPERDVVIEAVCKAEGECVQHQEEASTSADGLFRIRGLQPQCAYTIGIKRDAITNKHISKTLPEAVHISMNVTDVEDVRLTVIEEATTGDVSVLVTAEEPEHLRSLQLRMYDENDVMLRTMKIETGRAPYRMSTVAIALPSLPLHPTRAYYVQLVSSLPRSTYAYDQPVVSFTVNSTFRAVRMQFAPKLRVAENEVKHSYTAAVMAVLAALAYWFHEPLLRAAQGLLHNWPQIAATFPTLNRRAAKVNVNEDAFDFEPGLTVVKRKIKPRRL